jgi:lipopolysaccharide transport system ATP-binding protein
MSDIAIKVEDVGKLYRLGEVGTGTLSQDLKRWWAVSRGKEDPFAIIGETNDRTTKGDSEFVWALKNVSFDVKQGEVLGIIGRNGAGKSTLLKLLSKVTQPTTGNIKVKGRIASLLEVGTGFHPDLTGKENIFLNGAILGMTKKEIRKKFDEIVDFSGVERYIDTPVKRYSSGMYVRLAFAVAAHLESEILIVDEVLAVGDAEFQEKCLGKMGDVSKSEGRTVLYVSHQLGTIAKLCNKAILFEKGQVSIEGRPSMVIEKYLSQNKLKANQYETSLTNDNDMFVEQAVILNQKNEIDGTFIHNEEVSIRVTCKVNKWIRGAEVRMIVRDNKSINVFTTDTELFDLNANTKKFTILFSIPAHFLRPKEYSVTLALFIPHQYYIELLEEIIYFTINDGGTKYAQSEEIDYGPVFSPCKSQIVEILN